MSTIFFICLLILLSSCTFNKDNRLEYALRFAESNRTELEKVLDYYSTDPEKLAAARFLIVNMPYHYGYECWQQDTIKQILADAVKRKSVYGEDLLIIDKKHLDKWSSYSHYYGEKIYDSKIITADYLIENIDLSFEVWKKYPWNKHLSFDDFCEFILPYRIANEPLSNWRKKYYEHYMPKLDSLYKGTDVIDACSAVNQVLKKEWFYYNTDFSLPHLGGDYLFTTRVGYCRDACDVATYAMRSVGIPITTDYYIYSPDLRTWHCWNVVRDTTGQCYPFWYTKDEVVRSVANDGRRKGKAYRDCYGMQSGRFKKWATDNTVLPFFRNCFVKDVTDNYSGLNEISLPIAVSGCKYAYLGIFKNGSWEPVDIAQIEKGHAVFHNIEPDIVFQLLYVNNGNIKTYGYPFVYDKQRIIYFKPDTSQQEIACLKRKYPFQEYLFKYLNRNVIGTTIEGSNSVSGIKQLLYRFTDTLFTNRKAISFSQPCQFRYLHLNSPIDHRVELAEFVVFRDTSETQAIPLQLYRNVEGLYPTDQYSAKCVLDGNPLTFFRSREDNATLIFDMGNVTEFKKILVIPRNDDNFIEPGDHYELFYQNGSDGWKSLGQQIASSKELYFTVPHGAIFWLRNLTKGHAEQLFFIQEGKQVFSCDINFSKENAS